MTKLRAALVTPLTGNLSRFGREGASALELWADYTRAAELPEPFTEVELHVTDYEPDHERAVREALSHDPHVVFGPYGSSTAISFAKSTNRAIWNHGGATSALRWPDFPHVINVLSPARTYFDGILRAIREKDRSAKTITLLHGNTGFGRDVASGAMKSAEELGFDVRKFPFKPGNAPEVAATLPDADVLLVVGRFEDEVDAANVLLPGDWRFRSFVGAGTESVLAPIGELREGLIGSTQWMPSLDFQPEEGPTSAWFIEKFREKTGSEPSSPAVQAFAAGILCARCLRDCGGDTGDEAQLEAARNLDTTTLYGRFRLDPETGLKIGRSVLVVQWQEGERRVVWPPERADSELR